MSSRCQPNPPSTLAGTFTGSEGPALVYPGISGPVSGPPTGIASAKLWPAAPARSRQRRKQSRCIEGWSSSVVVPFARSRLTITFSPGASGLGSATVSATGTTPGSLEKTNASAVCIDQSGRSPRASTENTHSSPWRATSATGPCASGPNAWRRYM